MTKSASFARKRGLAAAVRAGWSSLPLCDDTLVEPNAMAKRLSEDGPRRRRRRGFQARLWVYLDASRLPQGLPASADTGGRRGIGG